MVRIMHLSPNEHLEIWVPFCHVPATKADAVVDASNAALRRTHAPFPRGDILNRQ